VEETKHYLTVYAETFVETSMPVVNYYRELHKVVEASRIPGCYKMDL
jgi:hypothetical protein